MRTLLAIVILASGIFVLNSPADAARNYKYYYPRGDSGCELRARAEDPTRLYAAYPCWARAALGRSGRGGR